MAEVVVVTDALLNISPMRAKASSHVRMFGAGNKLQPASAQHIGRGGASLCSARVICFT